MSHPDAKTPEQLHAAVDAAVRAHTPAEREWFDQEHNDLIASRSAHAYARDNRAFFQVDPGSQATVDPWLLRAVNDIASDDRRVVNVSGNPLHAGHAYIVQCGDSYLRTRKPGRKHMEFRLAYSLRTDGGPVRGRHQGRCDRCWLSRTIDQGRNAAERELIPLHVAYARWVAEAYLCADCCDDLRARAGEPVREAVAGG